MLDWLFHKENSDDWHVEKNQTKIPVEEVPLRIRKKIRQVEQAEMQELGLTIDSEINFCPHCGAKVQTAGAKFCVNCGKSLVDE